MILKSLTVIQREVLLRESEFCLAPVSGESGTDACFGDTGAPVVKHLGDGSFVLVGLGSRARRSLLHFARVPEITELI
jgi:hypothetical protein